MQLANMSFDELLDLTTVFFFNFVNKEPETYYDFSGGLHVFSGIQKARRSRAPVI